VRRGWDRVEDDKEPPAPPSPTALRTTLDFLIKVLKNKVSCCQKEKPL